MKGQKIPYNDNHRILGGKLQKKCNKHYIYFPNEDPWMPCTDEYFYTSKGNKTDGLHPECKRCCTTKSWDWQRVNPEKRKEHLKRINAKPKKKEMVKVADKSARERGLRRNWARNNPDKIKIYTTRHRIHNITDEEWEICLEYFNWSCAYCGLTLEEHKDKYNQQLHKDHIIHDGNNFIDNCCPACQTCNTSKHDKEFTEWYNEQNPKFTIERLNKIIAWVTEDWQNWTE